MRTDIDLKSAVYRWTKDRFNLRASFYTGRDPSSGDLSSTMLEQMYQGIKAEVGQEEATNFAKFVANLKDLSASAFIQAFERFWYDGCKYLPIRQKKGTGRRITGATHSEVISEAFVLLAEGLAGGHAMNADEIERVSESIKYPFVHDHEEEIGIKVLNLRYRRLNTRSDCVE